MSNLDNNRIFAENMRRRRRQLGLSQEKLGELCGLHRTYIGGIEQFLRNPSLASMEKIATALEIDISLLLNQNFEAISICEYAICHFHEGRYIFKPVHVCDLDPKIAKLLDDICNS